MTLVTSKRNVITLFIWPTIEIKTMTLPSIQHQPCTDSNCRGQHAPAERVALAMSLCGARGASAELEDPRVEQLLAEDAAVLEYRVTRRVVEVQGACASCIAAGPA